MLQAVSRRQAGGGFTRCNLCLIRSWWDYREPVHLRGASLQWHGDPVAEGDYSADRVGWGVGKLVRTAMSIPPVCAIDNLMAEATERGRCLGRQPRILGVHTGEIRSNAGGEFLSFSRGQSFEHSTLHPGSLGDTDSVRVGAATDGLFDVFSLPTS